MDPRARSIRDGYATIAGAYTDHLVDELAGKPLDRAFLDAFAERVAGAGLVLEVGCGPGQVAAYLHTRGVTIEGLDLSPEMIAHATARHPAIAFRLGDLFALPHAAASLAAAIGFYAIVHAPTSELGPPCRELARVVKSGGLVALAFHAGTEHTHVEELWGTATSLDFWFHEPAAVIAALAPRGSSSRPASIASHVPRSSIRAGGAISSRGAADVQCARWQRPRPRRPRPPPPSRPRSRRASACGSSSSVRAPPTARS